MANKHNTTMERIKDIRNRYKLAAKMYDGGNIGDSIPIFEEIIKDYEDYILEQQTKNTYSIKDMVIFLRCEKYYNIRIEHHILNPIRALCKYYLTANVELAKTYARKWVFWAIMNSSTDKNDNPTGVDSKDLTTNKEIHKDGCVYQYRPINIYSLHNLSAKTITLNNPCNFNDPFDCLFLSLIDEFENNEVSKLVYGEIKKVRIGSFVNNTASDPHKIKLMWSHYADSHRGMCVKYKMRLNFFDHWNSCDLNNTRVGLSVKYNNDPELKYDDLTKLSMRDLFAHKSGDWEYENEIRLIAFNQNDNSDYLDIPLNDDMIIDTVYFGCKCSEKNIEIVRKILGNNVKYMKAKPNKCGYIYDLTFEEI